MSGLLRSLGIHGVGVCAGLYFAVTCFFGAPAAASPVLSEIIPAHTGRSVSWRLAFEVDQLAVGKAYQLVLVHSGQNVIDRGMVVGYGQIAASNASTTRLLAASGWDEDWRVLGADRGPDAPELLLRMLPRLPEAVTALLLEGEGLWTLGSVIPDGSLSDPGWSYPLVDAVTFGADLEGVVPFAEGAMLEMVSGELGIRPWSLAAGTLDDWGVGPVVGGLVETAAWGLKASPGVANPIPHRVNPEPGTGAGLAGLGLGLLCGRRRGGQSG
ncbi:hypothetical protein [Mucisphaera sp.]|uniref:hypothetical protein n=1 Tax=Mucisphaera sp. TaxID=2913024 RepID=UPI003D112C50